MSACEPSTPQKRNARHLTKEEGGGDKRNGDAGSLKGLATAAAGEHEDVQTAGLFDRAGRPTEEEVDNLVPVGAFSTSNSPAKTARPAAGTAAAAGHGSTWQPSGPPQRIKCRSGGRNLAESLPVVAVTSATMHYKGVKEEQQQQHQRQPTPPDPFVTHEQPVEASGVEEQLDSSEICKHSPHRQPGQHSKDSARVLRKDSHLAGGTQYDGSSRSLLMLSARKAAGTMPSNKGLIQQQGLVAAGHMAAPLPSHKAPGEPSSSAAGKALASAASESAAAAASGGGGESHTKMKAADLPMDVFHKIKPGDGLDKGSSICTSVPKETAVSLTLLDLPNDLWMLPSLQSVYTQLSVRQTCKELLKTTDAGRTVLRLLVFIRNRDLRRLLHHLTHLQRFEGTVDLYVIRCLAISSLTHVNLSRSPHISDLSPLSACPQLQHLDVSLCGKVRDVTALVPLRLSLTYLDLSGTGVAQLTPVGQLTRLMTVKLSGCQSLCGVRPLDPLRSLLLLEDLDLSYANNVRDIQALGSCSSLKILSLEGTCVQDVTPLRTCSSLESLNLAGVGTDSSPKLQASRHAAGLLAAALDKTLEVRGLEAVRRARRDAGVDLKVCFNSRTP